MNHEELLNKVFTPDELKDAGGKRVLVALSGGADSVALLRLLLEAGFDCHAAHCNFHMRGEESMRDERFVRDLCQRLAVPLDVKNFDVPAWQQEHGGSVEMACRELRYAWFEQKRDQEGCDLIAVAHHADDQVETFFLNLLRGTGLRGLTGMRRMNEGIWRPLLGVTRNDIIDYLAAIGQDYVTDSTNAQNDYRRNRIRNVILPLIEQQFPNARARILDTMQNLIVDHELLEYVAEDYIDDYISIDIEDFCENPYAPTLLYYRIRRLGFNRDQCRQAVEAARQGRSGAHFTVGDHVLAVNRYTINVMPLNPDLDAELPINLGEEREIYNPIHLKMQHGGAPFNPRMCNGSDCVAFNTQLLDCHRIVLRHWRRGDRFQPFGMNGTRLVSDLFNDLKLDYFDRQNAWLLEADGEIIWVVGRRSSAHYPVEIGYQDYIILTEIIP